jgi:hypothetical protein
MSNTVVESSFGEWNRRLDGANLLLHTGKFVEAWLASDVHSIIQIFNQSIQKDKNSRFICTKKKVNINSIILKANINSSIILKANINSSPISDSD